MAIVKLPKLEAYQSLIKYLKLLSKIDKLTENQPNSSQHSSPSTTSKQQSNVFKVLPVSTPIMKTTSKDNLQNPSQQSFSVNQSIPKANLPSKMQPNGDVQNGSNARLVSPKVLIEPEIKNHPNQPPLNNEESNSKLQNNKLPELLNLLNCFNLLPLRKQVNMFKIVEFINSADAGIMIQVMESIQPGPLENTHIFTTTLDLFGFVHFSVSANVKRHSLGLASLELIAFLNGFNNLINDFKQGIFFIQT